MVPGGTRGTQSRTGVYFTRGPESTAAANLRLARARTQPVAEVRSVHVVVKDEADAPPGRGLNPEGQARDSRHDHASETTS